MSAIWIAPRTWWVPEWVTSCRSTTLDKTATLLPLTTQLRACCGGS